MSQRSVIPPGGVNVLFEFKPKKPTTRWFAALVLTESATTLALFAALGLPLEASIGLALLTPMYGMIPPVALSEALKLNWYEPGSFAPATLYQSS